MMMAPQPNSAEEVATLAASGEAMEDAAALKDEVAVSSAVSAAVEGVEGSVAAAALEADVALEVASEEAEAGPEEASVAVEDLAEVSVEEEVDLEGVIRKGS